MRVYEGCFLDCQLVIRNRFKYYTNYFLVFCFRAFSAVFLLCKFYTVCLIACILVVGFGMLRSESQVQQPPHQTIFRIFPVELWRKITQELHPKHLLTLRLISTHMNSIVIHRVLHYYPLRIYINSSHIFPLTVGRRPK